MWLLTPTGFFSIVRKPQDAAAGTLTVRSRVRADLDGLRDTLLPELGPTIENAGTDYRYRATAPKAAVAKAMAAMVEGLDYSNFKNAVAKSQGSQREHLYHEVWHTLFKLQNDPAFAASVTVGRSRTKPIPIPKADAYGGVLIDEQGRVLLREPTKHFGGYVWTFAKGGPDPGETPEEAALREVLEETGYAANIIAALPKAFGGTIGKTTAFFLMKPVGAQGKPSWETAQTRWVSFEEAPALIAQSTVAGGRSRDLAVLQEAQMVLASLRMK